MKKNSQSGIVSSSSRGFTLIELLVVIAIIGILAAVVLASLNSARAKGSDAQIKTQLANIRAQAALTYDKQACFGDGTTCSASAVSLSCVTAGTIFNEPVVKKMVTAIPTAAAVRCNSTANQTAWAISAALKTGFWCVDSQGASKQEGATLTSGQTACL